MLIKKISRILSVVFLLLIVGTLPANATLLTYDFDIQLDTVFGSNPYGLTAGDSVHANITIDTFYGVLDSTATYSMHRPATDSAFHMSLGFGSTIFNETDDIWYDAWPVVTVETSDWTIDTIDFLTAKLLPPNFIAIVDMVLIGAGYHENGLWGLTGNVPQGISPVPEPATIILFGSGLLGLIGVSRLRKR